MELTGLRDKVAIVTGASRGIGKAVAERFSQEGARLVLNHLKDEDSMRQVETTCASSGAEVATLRGDIGNPDTAKTLLDLAMNTFGRVDILVNNAGSTVENLLATTSGDEIEKMVSTNVLGLVWMTRAVMRPMLKQRSGSIINISSVLATRPGRGNAIYSGTKGFTESFTRALAAEIGRKDIRVNAVAPGVIETHMTVAVRTLAGEAIKDRIGLQRFGQPEEVADVVAFLASDQASYLNGTVVPVDGAFLGGM